MPQSEDRRWGEVKFGKCEPYISWRAACYENSPTDYCVALVGNKSLRWALPTLCKILSILLHGLTRLSCSPEGSVLLRLDSYLGVLMCIRCSVGFMRAAPSGHWRGRLCADGQKMCWCAAALGSMPNVVPRRDRELCFSMGVDDSNSEYLF